jgi:hypothetical protein
MAEPNDYPHNDTWGNNISDQTINMSFRIIADCAERDYGEFFGTPHHQRALRRQLETGHPPVTNEVVPTDMERRRRLSPAVIGLAAVGLVAGVIIEKMRNNND